MTNSQRVKMLREYLAISQAEFAKKIGVTAGAISQIENGGGVSSELLSVVCDKYNVNPQWLLSGKGEMFLEGGNYVEQKVLLNTKNQSFEKLKSDNEDLIQRNNLLSQTIDAQTKLIEVLERRITSLEGEVKVEPKLSVIRRKKDEPIRKP